MAAKSLSSAGHARIAHEADLDRIEKV